MNKQNTEQEDHLFVLIDFSWLIFRAYYGMPQMSSASNFPCGAIYGVIRSLLKLQKTFHTPHMVSIKDSPGKTFRHELLSDYKANRPELPADLATQLPVASEFVRLLGMQQIEHAGIEADDMIGKLALQAKAAGLTVVIVSADKDLTQLVDGQVRLYDPYKNVFLDRQGVYDKHNVYPEQVIDYLSLVGDSSDNIKGVEKVGAKTAAKWLAAYGDLQNLQSNSEQIKGVVGNNLRQADERLKLNRTLVSLKTDFPYDHSLESFSIAEASEEKWHERCDKYNFNSLKGVYHEFRLEMQHLSASNQLAADQSKQTKQPAAPQELPYELVKLQDVQQLREVLAQSQQQQPSTLTLHFDAQLDAGAGISQAKPKAKGADDTLAEFAAFAFAFDEPQKIYCCDFEQDFDELLSEFSALLKNPNIRKLLFDSQLARRHLPQEICGQIDDCRLLAYCTCAGESIAYEKEIVGRLASHYLQTEKIVDDIRQNLKTRGVDDLARDLWHLYWLFDNFWQNATSKEEFLYRELELPVAQILYEMYQTGILAQADQLQELSEEFAEQIDILSEEIYRLADEQFNINSSKQLAEILYEKLGMPKGRDTKGGRASTADEVLEQLFIDGYPIAGRLQEYRRISKLKSNYTQSLLDKISKTDGRVHTTYQQSVVASGRLSSKDPNLQNIPIRHEEGRKIRQVFHARAGYSLLSVDYSQIELRLMGHFSEDPALCASLERGEDIHQATASQIFSQPLAEVTRQQRSYAKGINFGLIYGMSSVGLARNLGISREEASEYMRGYFRVYPKVREYMQQVANKIKQDPYVSTIFGKKIKVDADRRTGAERRLALNLPLQGSAAEIIKFAMIYVHKYLHENQLGSKLLLQVHDELLFEVPDAELDMIKQKLPELMCDFPQLQQCNLKVKLSVGIGHGKNWDQAH